MKTFLKFALVGLVLTPMTAFSQYKHDIGLKLSSFERENLQLEYRWHANEKWAFTANLMYGIEGNRYYYENLLPGDTTFESVSNQYLSRNSSISIGAVRKFSFMKHNFYYVGAAIGGGYQVRTFTTYENVYELDPSVPTSPPYFFYYSGDGPIETTKYEDKYSNYSLISRLYFGVNVPIIDRVAVNFEGGMRNEIGGVYNSFVRVDFGFYGTVGLRYNFGKID